MMPQQVVNIKHIVSDDQCYDIIRNLRWPDGARCPWCDSSGVI
ncbi:MAG: transposase [Magnetococcales bacterium]|nr:transposase [Magnetococcales bacterium]